MGYALIILLAAVWVILVYNKALSWKIKVESSLNQIDVQLKAKAEKIPKLIEIAKKYADFELEIFEKTSVSRAQLIKAMTVEDAVKIDDSLNENIDKIFLLSEKYNKMKCDKAFKELRKQIHEIVNKTSMYRQYYNDTVMLNNRYLHSFPKNIVLKSFGFKEKEFLKFDVVD